MVANSPLLFLIGGSSSVGKTVLAGQVAQQFDSAVLHIDDLLGEVEDPAARFPGDIPSIRRLSEEELCRRLIAKGDALEPLLHDIVSRYLRGERRAVIEGEGFQPRFLCRWSGDARVHCGLVIEEDEQRLSDTLFRRSRAGKGVGDSDEGEAKMISRKMGHVNAMYGRWLRKEAMRRGAAWVPSQPWETLLDRFLQA